MGPYAHEMSRKTYKSDFRGPLVSGLLEKTWVFHRGRLAYVMPRGRCHVLPASPEFLDIVLLLPPTLNRASYL